MLLSVENLVTGYGRKQVVNGVSFSVAKGEVVALIGHNGAGKSTILKAVLKILPVWEGQIQLDGRSLAATRPCDLVRSGIAYVPQGNRAFGSLTVRENLEIAGASLDARTAAKNIDRSLDFFPSLAPKMRQRASTLSGGKVQMLALANALIPEPRILLMDEPSLGLAPPLVSRTLTLVQKICRETATAALVVEQKVRDVLKIAERVCVLRSGRVSYFGPASALDDEEKLRQVFL